MKKEKVYPFNRTGYINMQIDKYKEKSTNLNLIIGIVVVIGLFAFGTIGKEVLTITLLGKAINKTVEVLI